MGTLVLLLGSGYQIWTLLLSSKFIYSIGELLLNITSFNNSMYLNWGLVLPRSESLLSFVSCPHRPVSGKPLLISTPFTALWLAANIDFKNVTWLFKLSNGNAEKKRKRKKEIRMINQRRTHKKSLELIYPDPPSNLWHDWTMGCLGGLKVTPHLWSTQGDGIFVMMDFQRAWGTRGPFMFNQSSVNVLQWVSDSVMCEPFIWMRLRLEREVGAHTVALSLLLCVYSELYCVCFCCSKSATF